MLDQHISSIDHVRTIENKTAKNIGLFYHISQFLNEDPLKTVYFFLHSFIFELYQYCMASIYVAKLKRVYLKQKHAVCIVFNKDKQLIQSLFLKTSMH